MLTSHRLYDILLAVGTVAGAIVAVGGATGKLKKMWCWVHSKLFSHRLEMRRTLEAHREEMREALKPIAERVDKLTTDWNHEMKPNGGGSMRDVINRIENRVIIFEQRQRAVMTDAAVGVFETDERGDFVWVNRKFCRIVGRTTEELLGNGWLNAVQGDQRESVHSAWYDAVKDGREFHLNFSVTTPEGVTIPVHVRSIRMLDKERRLAGYIGFVSVIGSANYIKGSDPSGL